MSTYIVIPAPLVTGAERPANRADRAALFADRREYHLDLLRSSLDDRQAADGMISITGDPRERPWRGSSSGKGRGPRSLDALGAILVDDPNVDEIRRLREAGATLMENVEVEGVDPVTQASTDAHGSLAPDWHVRHVGADDFHARSVTGKGCIIGIADTGIDPKHPEFQDKTIHFAAFGPQGEPVIHAAKDYGDHGTHVAGIAAGKSRGIAPGASLAVAAVLTKKLPSGKITGRLAQALAGLNWLTQTDFGADELAAVNASLGCPGYSNYFLPFLQGVRDVDGVPVLAAIGNSVPSFNKHCSPGNYDCVLGVGAIDHTNTVAPFSAYGTVAQHHPLSKPDLVAPGVHVESAVPGGEFGVKSGTSMASPIVAGACALLAEEDPSLLSVPYSLENAILSRVSPVSCGAKAGKGSLKL